MAIRAPEVELKPVIRFGPDDHNDALVIWATVANYNVA